MSRPLPQVDRSTVKAPSRWAQRCLDAVLRLTVPIELPALAAAMRVNLAELAPAARHLLLELPAPVAADVTQTLAAFDLLVPDSPPVTIAADSAFWPAMQRHKPVGPAPSAPGSELTLPIADSGQVVALLVCCDLRRLECDTAWLIKLALIYRNQVRLLRRNEKDPLTGLYNRQAFDARLKTTVQAADRRRDGEPVCCSGCFALIDVDYFKSVNDKFGHLFGDEILMLITRLMTQSFRIEDLLFRYGGEEFGVLLTGARLADAQQALERFRVAVEGHAFPQVGRKTVSIGVVAIQAGDTVENVVARADKALYHAKNHGRNRVACYESLVAAGALPPVTVATGDIELF